MATARWSNLPPDTLSIISKLLNTDVDILHLRSVCSSWRSSVHRRRRPSPFPLKVPPLLSYDVLPRGGNYYLNYTTLYHLSPPKHGPHAGDPSDGWLFRVLEKSPNRFHLLVPLESKLAGFPPGTIPNELNLLDHRITEVCKCYNLCFVDLKGCPTDALGFTVRKVIVLRNYTVDCDFVVLVLFSDGRVNYWKFGDKNWTPVDAKRYDVTDVVVCQGKCYAIGRKGVLLSFDSKLKLTVVALPCLPVDRLKSENYLVEYKSDLYVVSRSNEDNSSSSSSSVGSNEEGIDKIPLRLKIFKKCNNWEQIRCLGDDMFLSCDDVSVGLSAEDFRGRRGNCVYLAHRVFVANSFAYGPNHDLHYGVFVLDGHRTEVKKLILDRTLFHWPPPGWLKKMAQDTW